MSFAWLPNAICVTRILLVLPTLLTLLAGRFELTLLLFGIAAASDALDGWLAKTFGWTSRLGKILDPIADKLLLVSVFVTLAWLGLVPAWLVVAFVVRDLVIVGGAVAYHYLVGYLEGQPTPVSKLNTLLQLSFGLTVVAAAAWPAVPDWLPTALGAVTFVTTIASGIDYVLTYARAAARDRRAAPRSTS